MLVEMVKTAEVLGSHTVFLPPQNLFSRGHQADGKTTPLPPWMCHQGVDARLDYVLRESKAVTRLYNIGVKVASLDLNETIERLYQESSCLIDTSNFAIGLYDEESDTLNYILIFSQGRRLKPTSVKPAKSELTAYILSQQIPLLIPDLWTSNRADSISTGPTETAGLKAQTLSARSWLGVPISKPGLPADKAQGVIITWRAEPQAFNQHDLWLLATIAAQAALPIANVLLFQANQRQALELAVINDIVETLASTLQLEDVLKHLMELIEGTLEVETGALLLTNPATKELIFQAALGQSARDGTIQPFRLGWSGDLIGHIAQAGQPVMLPQVEPKQRPWLKLADHLRVEPRNLLGIPLRLYEQVVGVLVVINKTRGTFTQRDQTLLTAIAPYAAIAIHNARLHQMILVERDRMVEIEEQVHKEMARDLHDGPTQLVSAMVMQADFGLKALSSNPTLVANTFTEIYQMGQRAIHQMRTLLMALRPLELEQHGQGLAAALQVFLERRQKEVPNTRLTFEVQPHQSDGQLTRQEDKVESTLFAIVQETVTNALKHAGASHIRVQLIETATDLNLRIVDNGKGFDMEQILHRYAGQGSLGLLNIQERAELIGGQLNLNSAPGRGTRITLCVPKTSAERRKKRVTTGSLTMPPGYQSR